MPWPRRYQLHSGSLQVSADTITPARRVNRYAHVTDVLLQALRLEDEEPVMLEKHWMTIAEWPPMQPLRGVRRVGESDGAVLACNDYLRMNNRSLVKLRMRWQKEYDVGWNCLVPTLDTFKSWSRRFQWQARAMLYDAQDSIALRTILDQRRAQMEAGTKEYLRRNITHSDEESIVFP